VIVREGRLEEGREGRMSGVNDYYRQMA